MAFSPISTSLLVTLLAAIIIHQLKLSHTTSSVLAQKNILAWKWDLDFRLGNYARGNQELRQLIELSRRKETLTINGNANFKRLIINPGSLILNKFNHINNQILVNKTLNYLSQKSTEAARIYNILNSVRRQLNDQSRSYIPKGEPNNFNLSPPRRPIKVSGSRYFRQFQYAHSIESIHVTLNQINNTIVDPILDRAFMRNMHQPLYDSQQRLFFEGSKTISHSVFLQDLQSGCCGRLKPIYSNRIMTKSSKQTIKPPVYLLSNANIQAHSVGINFLYTNQIVSRMLALANFSPQRPKRRRLTIIETPVNYVVDLQSLVSIKNLETLLLGKSLIFTSALRVEDFNLPVTSLGRPRISVSNSPNLQLDLVSEIFLLKYAPKAIDSINASRYELSQKISSPIQLNGDTLFLRELMTLGVNEIDDFVSFVQNALVRIDRPAYIKNLVQFSALPAIFSKLYPSSKNSAVNSPIIVANRGIQIGRLNSMNLSEDLILTKQIIPRANILTIKGPLIFMNPRTIMDFVIVRNTVNNLIMPDEVIPLHLNDAMSSFLPSHLAFVDGVNVNHLTIQSSQLGNLKFHDAFEDAESFVLRTSFTPNPQGLHMMNAKVRISNLKLNTVANSPGLINGFRPDELASQGSLSQDLIFGRRHFANVVEVSDCQISGLNHMTNWTHHLIRIDRGDFVQNIQTNLVFLPFQLTSSQFSNQAVTPQQPPITINRLNIGFLPNNDQGNYLQNMAHYPELWILNQVLFKEFNQKDSRYRIGKIKMLNPRGRGLVNGIPVDQIVRLDELNNLLGKTIFIGKVVSHGSLMATHAQSSYPLDSIDLIQFDKYRVPLSNSGFNKAQLIKFNNLILSGSNQVPFVKTFLLNGLLLDKYITSIMSLTRVQLVQRYIKFTNLVGLEGFVWTNSSINRVRGMDSYARMITFSNYDFLDGLECQRIII